ncbi:Phosphoadenosine phosphosulfate reductase (plasmid) [Deinococcus gobiensis I-0]|uniref:Phosphoadenosine phosphosulfate reductase n=2 Tax=Deinococcus TaxID=1298 RepID=H8H1B2_DEIGI|nr:Phosphoadenosine phosphosulfate reductase [Deinococcus gobiensis I-0]
MSQRSLPEITGIK